MSMYEKYNIKEIRFLPMSEEEFATEEEAREYLRYQLPKKENGEYWYQTKGIDSENEILVLFRIHSCIIGVGIFKKRKKNQDGEVVISNGKEYHGRNIFYPETIFNIETITLDEYQVIDKDLERFTQSMKKTDIKYLPEVLALVEEKWKAYNK